MSLFSFSFFVFLCVGVLVYYLLPGRWQWVCLLVLSGGFYACAGPAGLLFPAVTIVTTWLGGLAMARVDRLCPTQGCTPAEKKARRAAAKAKKRRFFWAVLGLNFGVLAWLKYVGPLWGRTGLLLPLGISFYTFSAMGYLIDVYRGTVQAQRSLPRLALFVGFFPQLLQGPIVRWDQTGPQLLEPHSFRLTALQHGIQRMLWGYFKKMVIADRAAVLVDQVFGSYDTYPGSVLAVGVLFYSLQQYADFSGGIDVVLGAAELFGIRLPENFTRPYFSHSLSEFWRRWHISLGAWMRDYLFYPLSISRPMARLGKWAKAHLGRSVGRVLPVCLANVAVFLVVGVWHGASAHYAVWGLYNGLVIAGAALLEPLFDRMKTALRVNVHSRGWRVFQILRTFAVVNVGWYFDRALTVRAGADMLVRTFARPDIAALGQGILLQLGLTGRDFLVLAVATAVLFFVSVLQERGFSIRTGLDARPLWLRWTCYTGLLIAVLGLAAQGTDLTGGFLYAQF